MTDIAITGPPRRRPLPTPLRLMASIVLILALIAAATAGWLSRRDDGQPAVAIAAAGAGDTLAVIYSGDGGWAAIDRGLTDGLVRAGTPVVGYSSLRYFSTARTPQGAADDLAVTLRQYMAAWGKQKVILVGYSFGADALPVIVPHLPADLRARVRLVALVGLEAQGELKVHAGSWLNWAGRSAYPVAPAVTALGGGAPMVCVYGSREPHPVCPTLSPTLIRRVELKGGHHFDRDYGAISRAILQALPQA
ncbi:MAG: virulence factor [Alphaproteobacteria bacterium]|nr:virulence factor [Alphaproteobacteria bacterium]MBU1515600.1 virulence factor [Alphaproteobacteria bacterium]MBU2096935.1 virulence factor [Alphaproteobacteria bacterium]MBU2149590.1 virulence factor [Alphaproteobacteria bacterium]MBU2305674.1 virulence factor [Alphaproteobacteria bacterium]